MDNVLEKRKKNFLYSDLYLILIVACVFIFWQLKLDIVGMCALVFVFSVVMCFSSDATPVVPIVIGFMLIMSENHGADFVVNNLSAIILLAVVVMGSIAVFFSRNKIKFVLGKQFWGFLVMSVCLALGGILYDVSLTIKSLPSVFTIVACMLGVYLVFNNIVKPNGVYFAKIMAYTGVLLALQTLSFYVGGSYNLSTLISQKLLAVGWGVSNSIGSLLLLTIPMTLYLVARTRMPIFYVLLFFVQCATLLLSLSRGAILMGVFGIPLALVFACAEAKSKKTVMFTLLYLLLGAVVGLVVMKDELIHVLNQITRQTDSGRFGLYEEGIRDMLKSPIFGLSMYGREASLGATNIFKIHWYHCTAVQYAANAGIVGLCGYLFHLLSKYKMLLSKGTPLKKFIFIGILMWSGYAFIDVGYFLQNQLVFFVLMLVFAEKNVYNSKEESRISDKKG